MKMKVKIYFVDTDKFQLQHFQFKPTKVPSYRMICHKLILQSFP